MILMSVCEMELSPLLDFCQETAKEMAELRFIVQLKCAKIEKADH